MRLANRTPLNSDVGLNSIIQLFNRSALHTLVPQPIGEGWTDTLNMEICALVVFPPECRRQSVLSHLVAVVLLRPAAHHRLLLHAGRVSLEQVRPMWCTLGCLCSLPVSCGTLGVFAPLAHNTTWRKSVNSLGGPITRQGWDA